jgi:hypothetical protein
MKAILTWVHPVAGANLPMPMATYMRASFLTGSFLAKAPTHGKTGVSMKANFVNGLKSGLGNGVLYYKDGSKYVGRWYNDLQHGPGTEYDAAGNVTKSGNWDNGVYLKQARYMAPRPTLQMRPLPVLKIQAPSSPKGDNVPKDGYGEFFVC